jgi:heme/copper-type cytochrome/quinol oxidase subunit 3
MKNNPHNPKSAPFTTHTKPSTYYIQINNPYNWANTLQEEKNVKWILVISFIMLLPSIIMGTIIYPYYYYPSSRVAPDMWATLALYTNRLSTLLFIATITTSTLATAGIPRKNLLATISIYLFTAAMALLFLTMIRLLFTFP